MRTRRTVAPLLLVLHAAHVSLPAHSDGLVDPTRPPIVAERGTPAGASDEARTWALESTLVSPERRIAVINGQPVSEGESVDGARVIAIGPREVVLGTLGKRIRLRLLSEVVRERRP